jgi:hypothetical protein
VGIVSLFMGQRRRWWSVADGCRTFDERKPIEPSYPSITPSIADFVIANGEATYTSDEEELRFAPPG